MKIHFTSGYHPEANGQTEQTNQTLEQYIRVYYNYQQDNWSELLPLAQFAYNNAPSTTTGVTPFFTNKGYHLNISVYPECDLASARACDFVTDLDELHQELCTAMAEAQEHYKISADQNRLPAPDFQIGQMVMVKAKYICTTQLSQKLGPKNHGPFKIIAQPGPVSFTLELPLGLRRIHPVFHTSMLEPITPNSILNRTQDPPPPVEINSKVEYIVEAILDSKIDCCRTCPLQYFVKWEGYDGTPEETSWTDVSLCENTLDLIKEFHRHYPHKPGPLAKLWKP